MYMVQGALLLAAEATLVVAWAALRSLTTARAASPAEDSANSNISPAQIGLHFQNADLLLALILSKPVEVRAASSAKDSANSSISSAQLAIHFQSTNCLLVVVLSNLADLPQASTSQRSCFALELFDKRTDDSGNSQCVMCFVRQHQTGNSGQEKIYP